MANLKQLEIAKQGAAIWNGWRKRHPERDIDLRGADLSNANLSGAKLTGARLNRANLGGADLGGANLNDADLSGAQLVRANLSRAYLSGADLSTADLTNADLSKSVARGASLRESDLSNAILREASLKESDLSRAKLSNANFSGADLGETSFAGSTLWRTVFALTSLKTAEGLETCRHDGPSSLDWQTLMDSGPLPEVFLRGCGLSDEFIRYLPEFRNEAIQFYSCFISYSHADKAFARRLHDALQGRGIRCWLDEHQLLPGDNIHRAVDEGIRLWDKVLLCCSEAALTSWWVDKEIQKALKKEEELWKQRGKEVLAIIPLNLDGYMLKPEWEDWKRQHVTSRLAADFTGWKNDDDKFNEQLERVVQALRAGELARERPPKSRL